MATEFDLMVAPNGARLTKADHPALPITPDEVANTARACARAGAGAIHVHVRGDHGLHSLDPKRYAQTAQMIAKQTDIGIQISTEAVGQFDVATQMACLQHAPCDDASVSIREIARDPALFASAYEMAAQKGIDIQHILYDSDDLELLLRHYDTGDIPERSRRALFVLGRKSEGQRAKPDEVQPFLKALGTEPLNWSLCAFGQDEQACLLAALNHGGGARIGFENNIIAPDGTVFPDNATSVASFVEAADKAGFRPHQGTP